MSDEKKKVFGRGRGKGPTKKQEGPWTRTKTVEETKDNIRRPKQDEEETKEFRLTPSSFPPLPGLSQSEEHPKETEAEFTVTPESFPPLGGSVETTVIDSNLPEKDTKDEEKTIESKEKTDESLPTEKCELQTEEISSEPAPPVVPEPTSEKATQPEDCQNTVMSSLKVDTSEHILEVSNLSPLAAEFVPRNLMNPAAEDFVPYFGAPEDSGSPEDIDESLLNFEPPPFEDFEKLRADLLETIAFCTTRISENPGDFDDMMQVVTKFFTQCMEYTELNEIIVSTLYGFAVNHGAAYHAVKMLCHLIDVSQKELQSEELRAVLLRLAQKETISMQNGISTNTECESVWPFLNFLGELYNQVEAGGMRLLYIGKALVGTLTQYLEQDRLPIKRRLVDAANTLKLTGTFLDQDDRSLLDRLTELINQKLQVDSIDVQTVAVVCNVLRLRQDNWGKKMEPLEVKVGKPAPLPPNMMPSYEQASNMMGTFYGPDGNVIPYEEQVFLQSAVESLPYDQQSEPSPTGSAGSMDGEMFDAYDEFLQNIPGRPNLDTQPDQP